MMIKRISYIVKEGHIEKFYEYQNLWKHLSEVEGFLGQIGGWSKIHPLNACIYSFWESQTDYQRFMEKIHDKIFGKSRQESNYNAININLFQEELSISGLEDSIENVLKKGSYIRVSLSQVKEHKAKHFVRMQKEVWNKGMRKEEGMLGGAFALSKKDNSDFLLFTGWKSENCHEKYMEESFPELLKTAKSKNDILKLTREQFKVEEAWRVCP